MPPKTNTAKELSYPKKKSLPAKAKKWMVPCSWLVEQANKQLALGRHSMIFGSDGKNLYVLGFLPSVPSDAGQLQVLPMAPSGGGTPGPVMVPMLGPGGPGGDEEVWLEDWPEP
jgi:hypothetical protein